MRKVFVKWIKNNKQLYTNFLWAGFGLATFVIVLGLFMFSYGQENKHNKERIKHEHLVNRVNELNKTATIDTIQFDFNKNYHYFRSKKYNISSIQTLYVEGYNYWVDSTINISEKTLELFGSYNTIEKIINDTTAKVQVKYKESNTFKYTVTDFKDEIIETFEDEDYPAYSKIENIIKQYASRKYKKDPTNYFKFINTCGWSFETIPHYSFEYYQCPIKIKIRNGIISHKIIFNYPKYSNEIESSYELDKLGKEMMGKLVMGKVRIGRK